MRLLGVVLPVLCCHDSPSLSLSPWLTDSEITAHAGNSHGNVVRHEKYTNVSEHLSKVRHWRMWNLVCRWAPLNLALTGIKFRNKSGPHRSLTAHTKIDSPHLYSFHPNRPSGKVASSYLLILIISSYSLPFGCIKNVKSRPRLYNCK
jgi:hypothetical protein